MKAALIFTGSSPILIITSYPSLEDKRFLEKLKQKGIDKFIAFEVQLEIAKEKYGNRFDLITADLNATEDMRILDYNGQLAFERFSFEELGEMIKHDGHNM
ncbi:MAG: hypothetical protein ACUZ8I_04780 [Candidatus Scalindua sp.]